MNKLKSTLPNMVLSLGGIALLSGLCLSLLYSVTKGPIDRTAARQQSEAISEVLPPHDNNPEEDMAEIKAEGTEFEVYPAMEGTRLAGAAVKGTTNRGFGGDITVICGFDSRGNVVDYRVLQHAETPGLGSKMELWFRDPAGARSIIGRSPATASFSPAKDGGDVDAITAATISSRAFLWLISASYEAYRQYAESCGATDLKGADASSGASGKAVKESAEEPASDAVSGASGKAVKESAEEPAEKAASDAVSGASSGHENRHDGEGESHQH